MKGIYGYSKPIYRTTYLCGLINSLYEKVLDAYFCESIVFSTTDTQDFKETGSYTLHVYMLWGSKTA